MRRNLQLFRLTVSSVLALLMTHLLPALAWNPPGHMLSGSIAYQVLQRESPSTVGKVKSLLEKHPWYEKHWRPQLNNLPDSDHNEILFMLAPKWADDVRTLDREQHHQGPWHYINWPFKPDGEPESVGTRPPQPVNILTALAENERIVRSAVEPEKKAIALTWLFHLVGDVHQPLHTIQIFTKEYPVGDRGGNEICVRVRADGQPIDLHRFWDRVITSSTNFNQLRNEATALRNRPAFAKGQLTELASSDYAAWAKEGYEIATKITYQNGQLRGTPKGQRKECRDGTDATLLPPGYTGIAKRIADRRIMLAGYRLATVLEKISANLS
jgi:hypothetical protein